MSDSENDTSTFLRIKFRQDMLEIQHAWSMDNLAQVQNVMIEIEANFTGFTEIGLQVLEENLGAATNIQSINIERLVQADTSIPVSALMRILRLPNMARLVDLRVLGTRLEGTMEDWFELSRLLDPRHLPCLEFICLVEPISWLQHIPAGALDPLLRVCANHSALKFLATNLISGVSLEAIDDFCHSPQIMGLHLVDTDVSEDRVFRFLKSMQTNTKVWFLSVAFAEDISEEQGKAIVNLLQKNTMIANLSIKSKKPIQEHLIVELANGLVHSFVEEFMLEGTGEGPTLNENTRQAISNMLELNTSLYRFHLDGVICDGLEKEIGMMMRLNRAGRKLLGNATPRQWVDVLSNDSLRDDLDCVYYLLSKNPELFSRIATRIENETTKAALTSASRKRKFNDVAGLNE